VLLNMLSTGTIHPAGDMCLEKYDGERAARKKKKKKKNTKGWRGPRARRICGYGPREGERGAERMGKMAGRPSGRRRSVARPHRDWKEAGGGVDTRVGPPGAELVEAAGGASFAVARREEQKIFRLTISRVLNSRKRRARAISLGYQAGPHWSKLSF